MPDATDMELIRDYTREDSEPAFAEIVQRHVSFVFSIALRHVGIAAQAEEITQAVFVILAKKAGELRPDTVLEGWLYRTTRLTSLSFMRTERRRQFREQEAYMQSTLHETGNAQVWEQLAPLLDEAMTRLGQNDRDALTLRFFKDKNLREVAAALGTNEAAAQKRVLRGLEKLRTFFVRRGVVLTTAVIAGAISANSVQAAPAGLAAAVANATVAKGAAAGGSTSTLVKGALKLMAWTKAKLAIGVAVGVLLTAGTTTVVVTKVEAYQAYHDSWRTPDLNSDIVAQTAPQVGILPTKFDNSVNGLSSTVDSRKWAGVGVQAGSIVWAAYGWRPGRILFPDGEPPQRYDFVSTLAQGTDEALQREMERKLRLVGRRETRDLDVLVLKVRNPDAPGLKPPIAGSGDDWMGSDRYYCGDRPISRDVPVEGLTKGLEEYFQMPVIDETGLTQHFNIDLRWKERGRRDPNHDALKKALFDQLGFELVPDHQPVEMLVMEKAAN
jgi:uncharacterized protein (TIGR03435 family)